MSTVVYMDFNEDESKQKAPIKVLLFITL